MSFLWSGSEEHLGYFQKRIFGSNSVSLERIGRRPMMMLDSLLSKFDCSFGAIILRREVVPVLERPGDVSLPLWVNCDINLCAERAYAKSESLRGGLRKIRKSQLTWRVSSERDDFEFLNLCRLDLAGLPIHHRYCLAGIINEGGLAGSMVLSHHQVHLVGVLPIMTAKPAVLDALAMGAFIFFPQQE